MPYKQVVKGYELRKGEYVVLSQDEITAAEGEHSHAIELEEFVCAGDVDPVYYERTYYLGQARTDRTLTGSCTMRWRKPVAPGLAGGCSTTASIWLRCDP